MAALELWRNSSPFVGEAVLCLTKLIRGPQNVIKMIKMTKMKTTKKIKTTSKKKT